MTKEYIFFDTNTQKLHEYKNQISKKHTYIQRRVLFKQMLSENVKPNKELYDLLLEKIENYKTAIELFVEMESYGLKLDEKLYSYILKLSKSRWDVCIIYKEMISKGLILKRKQYSAIVTSSRDHKEIQRILRIMITQKLEVTPKDILSYIEAYKRSINIKNSKNINSVVNNNIYESEILEGINKVDTIDNFFQFLKSISTGLNNIDKDSYIYKSLVKQLRDISKLNLKTKIKNTNDISKKDLSNTPSSEGGEYNSNSKKMGINVKIEQNYLSNESKISLKIDEKKEFEELPRPKNTIIDFSDNNKYTNHSEKINDLGKYSPNRKKFVVNRVMRNQVLVEYLKNLYYNKCQICGEGLHIGINQYYSEVHHIKPLGKHSGDDVSENMIVLCPNHHVLFDRGIVSIDIENKKVIHFDETNILHNKQMIYKHEIDRINIDYHNTNIYIGQNVIKKYNIDNDIMPIREYNNNSHDLNNSKNIKRQVDYGDEILLLDVNDNQFEIKLKLEEYQNRHLMDVRQKEVLHKYDGEQVLINSYPYIIKKS